MCDSQICEYDISGWISQPWSAYRRAKLAILIKMVMDVMVCLFHRARLDIDT